MPSCTIAIPVYNRRELVRRALESALAEHNVDLDILVVDNCSTDGTWEVLQTYVDPRLRLVRNERNLGLFGNFNRCLELAQGRYLRFLCSDDRLVTGSLGREISVMEQFPSVALLSTRLRLVNEQGRDLGIHANSFAPGIYNGIAALYAILWVQLFYGRNALNYPSGVLLRRESALRAGIFDESLRVVGDIDFFFRVLGYGDLAVIDTVGCEILEHGGQIGPQIMRDGTLIHEYLVLVQRFEAILSRTGPIFILERQVPGAALWLGLALARRGFFKESLIYWSLAHKLAPSRSAALSAFSQIAFRRLSLVLRRKWHVSLRPIEQIDQLL